MIVKTMEKTERKGRGKCLFNSPALQAQIPIIYQLVHSSHSQSELPAKDQKSRRLEYPVAERPLPLLLVPQPFSTRYTLNKLSTDIETWKCIIFFSFTTVKKKKKKKKKCTIFGTKELKAEI
ncbi:Small Integral Membrane Protein 27 [Manis pentadactyla]|nr:Small Integral Membrane Protein 27 [Manis pentadactyla]